MPRHFRERLALSYSLWCVAFVAALVGFAWKFGWIPVEMTPPETGTVAQHAPPENGAPTTSNPPATSQSEWPADPQSEPAVDSGFDREPVGSPESSFAASPDDSVRLSRTPSSASRKPLPFETTTFPPRAARPSRNLEGVASISGDIPADLGNSEPAPRSTASGSTPRRTTRIESPQFDEGDVPTRTRPLKRSANIEPEQYRPRAGIKTVNGEFDEESDGNQRSSSAVVQAGGEIEVDPRMKSGEALDPRIQAIDDMLAAGDRLPAHKEMSKLYWKEAELRPLLQERIDASAKIIYFSPQPHFMDPYVVQGTDRLSKIAKLYEVPWEYLVRVNQADPKRIRPGQRLKVIKGPFAALVDLSDFELIVHAHGYYVKRYRIGIGKDESTPIGKFAVKTKLKNPTYYGQNGNVIDADDPANPLGERWIDIGDSYGIHGTIDPDSIGKAESKGCVRLDNADIEELYDLLGEGSEVIIRK